MRALLIAASLVALSGARLHSQTEDLPPAPPGYQPVVPETIEAQLDKAKVDTGLFSLRWGLAPILHYTWFARDQSSIDQVGVQEDAFRVRSGRAMARGTLSTSGGIPGASWSASNRGLDSNPDDTWSWTDVWVLVPLGRFGSLTVGKEKEGFSYEIVGDAANLEQVERLMNAFAGTRNAGLKLANTALGDRAT